MQTISRSLIERGEVERERHHVARLGLLSVSASRHAETFEFRSSTQEAVWARAEVLITTAGGDRKRDLRRDRRPAPPAPVHAGSGQAAWKT